MNTLVRHIRQHLTGLLLVASHKVDNYGRNAFVIEDANQNELHIATSKDVTLAQLQKALGAKPPTTTTTTTPKTTRQ